MVVGHNRIFWVSNFMRSAIAHMQQQGLKRSLFEHFDKFISSHFYISEGGFATLYQQQG